MLMFLAYLVCLAWAIGYASSYTWMIKWCMKKVREERVGQPTLFEHAVVVVMCIFAAVVCLFYPLFTVWIGSRTLRVKP